MSTRGQFNSKNPTIKRILKEASELANNASADYHATPLEDNLFEWHFTLRGPPAPSPYEHGIYHGRIVLPNAYPHRPPSFRFLTPSGRFEVNREICLSISGFHEETWQPAWGIRTALVAIRSFMDTGAKGQIGGLECDAETRKKFADQSRVWKCPGCGMSNEEILKEREEVVKVILGTEGASPREEEKVPDELRLAYREDLEPETASSTPTGSAKGKERATEPPATALGSQSQTGEIPSSIASQAQPQRQSQPLLQPRPTRTVPQQAARQATRDRDDEGSPAWLDHVIYAVITALVLLLLRKLL